MLAQIPLKRQLQLIWVPNPVCRKLLFQFFDLPLPLDDL